MALVIGTNVGFVTTAPTSDPSGDADFASLKVSCVKDNSPSGNNIVTEIGWWCENASPDANFEVGIYDDNAGVPDNLLSGADLTNAKSDTIGWKVVTGLNISISATTDYWIAFQLDGTTPSTFTDIATSGGSGRDVKSATTLPDPFDGGGVSAGMIAIYAKVESVSTGTNLQINISDVWKEVPAVQINIADSWKSVVGMQLNIGDTWREIF